jgi:hypothetical protein
MIALGQPFPTRAHPHVEEPVPSQKNLRLLPFSQHQLLLAWHQWLTPIILATWEEAEIRRIIV